MHATVCLFCDSLYLTFSHGTRFYGYAIRKIGVQETDAAENYGREPEETEKEVKIVEGVRRKARALLPE